MMKVVLTILSLFVWCVMFVSITSASVEAFIIKFGLMEKDKMGTYLFTLKPLLFLSISGKLDSDLDSQLNIHQERLLLVIH